MNGLGEPDSLSTRGVTLANSLTFPDFSFLNGKIEAIFMAITQAYFGDRMKTIKMLRTCPVYNSSVQYIIAQ